MATHWFDDPAFVRRVRRHLAMTQKRLGREAGISRALVNAIEHGERRMTVHTRSKIWATLIDAELEIKRVTLIPLTADDHKWSNLNVLAGVPTAEEVKRELARIEEASNAELDNGTGA